MICDHCHQKTDFSKTRSVLGKVYHDVCYEQCFTKEQKEYRDRERNIVIHPACDICGHKLVEDDGDNTTCGRCNQRFNPELKRKVRVFLGDDNDVVEGVK